ncbi:T6SS immunity protein Tdi1 domain-containing protein [Herbiconiux sp. P17]|uniref:T6SS immunity protein Tdi1 domain-containing protein n=1 Tax=Herbiconiux wuyangfengii TaxID=3342794 RepID=UPI0035B807B9
MFILDADVDHGGPAYAPRHFTDEFAKAGYSGRSFNKGLLRFHDAHSGPEFLEHIRVAFPSIADPHASAIAFDWMGRQIVCARTKKRFGWTDARLLLADVDFAQLDELGDPDSLSRVLSNGQYRHALAEPQFESWREATGTAALAFDECVEYTIPPFIGGAQTQENMAVMNTSVHWGIVSQLVAKTRGLAPGTPLGPFSVGPR